MHPMAMMGIAVVVAGLLATTVALSQLARHGVNLWPVFLGNGLPLALFVLTVILSTRRATRGGRAAPILLVGFALSAAAWWFLNF